MPEVYLYNESLFFKSRLKNLAKKILGIIRGPKALFDSLTKGLDELGAKYFVNKKPKTPIDTACVISDVKTLVWAIGQKRKGLIKKIIAGPNLVITPNDFGGILKSPAIDKIIAPSQWVKDFYALVAPELKDKIYIWAAGTALPPAQNSKKNYDFLIYCKLGKDAALVNHIQKHLTEKGYKYKLLVYGSFKQEEYFDSLIKSKFLIYLSPSESQGLAMFEAWARNVSTLVLDKGMIELEGKKITGNIASPYVTETVGMRFSDIEGFSSILPSFMSANFNPRRYVEQNFTNKLAAQKYLEIINA